jgi:hypothetical protein
MADIHDRAVIATVGIAIDQKVAAALGPHMAQSHGCQLSNFDRRHASQLAPPSAFRQEPPRDAKTGEPPMKWSPISAKRLPSCDLASSRPRLIGAPAIPNARRFKA